jgi:hypothetical protein
MTRTDPVQVQNAVRIDKTEYVPGQRVRGAANPCQEQGLKLKVCYLAAQPGNELKWRGANELAASLGHR